MRMKVQLYVAGKTFYEYMEAVDYSHARQIALARNPGATVIGCNADYSSDDNSGGFLSSSSSSSASNVSNSESSGLGGLAVLAIGGWLAWEAWKLGSAIVIAAWQWIVSASQWFMGLFSWIPFMSPQLLVGLVFGFFFLVLILGALDD